jgi:glycosyltransferase involved in cell wall biosynthesis
MAPRVIYIVRSWPRLSQTFVLNEVLALERRGVELTIFSLVRSDDPIVHPQVADVRARVEYLDEGSGGWPARRWKAHASVFSRVPAHFAHSLVDGLWRRDLTAGYGEATGPECFDMAVRIAYAIVRMRQSGATPVHVHAHFAHDPALVGMFAARLTGLPFTFTAHARDLVQISVGALTARAAAARAVVTCCALNAEYIGAAVGESHPRVLVIPHGVDLRRFRPSSSRPRGGVPTFVSIGRLVEKKGFDDLLQALRLVKDRGRRFRCEIYGDGPDHERLEALCASLGLSDEVHLPGARDAEGIAAALRSADAFVLTPRVAANGDRDGIPNVLIEAMASGLPVVTTAAGGVTEVVEHDANGLLAEPRDVPAIARLLCRVIDEPQERRRLGLAARSTVERSFDIDTAAEALHRLMVPSAETAFQEEVR